jgi:hypothetical protein
MLRQPWAVVAAVLVLAVYAAVLAVMPKGGFWSPDEGAKFIQLNSLSLGQPLIAYGGAALDPTYAFYPTQCYHDDLYPLPLPGGGVKFHWPIWYTLANRPLVAVFGLTGLYLLSLLSGWLVALVAGHLVRAWDAALAPWAILLVGLGTPIAFFSLTFWEHTPTVLLGLVALAIVASPRLREPRTVWMIAPLLLVAARLRVETLLFGVAVVGAWLVTSRRTVANRNPAGLMANWRVAATVVLAIVGGLALVLTIGLPERHRWMLSVLPQYLGASGAKLPYLPTMLTAMLVHVAGNRAPEVGTGLVYAVLIACAVLAVAPLIRRPRNEAIALILGLGLVLEFSLYLILRPDPYVSLHGLIPVAPLLVLAPYALPPAWRGRDQAQLTIVTAAVLYFLLSAVIIFLFLFTKTGVMPTGLEWGNRYLFYLYPLGVVLALAAVHEYGRSTRTSTAKSLFTATAAALAVCGLLLQVRGVWTLVESRRVVTAWQDALRDEPPVLTDVWWLPAAMAPLFITHEVQCIRRGDDLGKWLGLADQQGLETFTFASFRRFNPARAGAARERVTRVDERLVDGLYVTRVRIAPPSSSAAAAPAPTL